MPKVYITNTTAQPIDLKGWHGTWKAKTNQTRIMPYAIGFDVGTVDGGNQAWVGLQSAATVGPDLQAYVYMGSGGPRDYAIQFYDGGKSDDGQTIMGTKAAVHNGEVYLTIDYTFDPWTSRLPGTKRLYEVTIPGTHDSATYDLEWPSQCQDTTIEEQLYIGVRHFDIRLDSSVKGYRVVHGGAHGSGNTEYYLADIAKMMRKFLVEPVAGDSRQETVILQLKIDRGDDDGAKNDAIIQILKNVFRARLGHLYLSPQTPIKTMADLRGKLVVLRRFELANEYSSQSCIPIKYFVPASLGYAWSQGGSSAAPWKDVFDYSCFEWPDQGTSEKAYSNRFQMTFVIQDGYKLEPIAKALATMAFIDGAVSGAYDGGWYLNFSSTADPPASAALINPLLAHFLATKPNRPTRRGYGTLLTDFANLDLVRALVSKNF